MRYSGLLLASLIAAPAVAAESTTVILERSVVTYDVSHNTPVETAEGSSTSESANNKDTAFNTGAGINIGIYHDNFRLWLTPNSVSALAMAWGDFGLGLYVYANNDANDTQYVGTTAEKFNDVHNLAVGPTFNYDKKLAPTWNWINQGYLAAKWYSSHTSNIDDSGAESGSLLKSKSDYVLNLQTEIEYRPVERLGLLYGFQYVYNVATYDDDSGAGKATQKFLSRDFRINLLTVRAYL